MTFTKAAIFGASGGIGGAMTSALAERGTDVHAGSRSGSVPSHERITPFTFDLEDEASIAAAVAPWKDDPPDLVVVASGVLTLPDGTGPERSFKHLDGDVMAAVLRLNAIGPALIAKHVLPLLSRDRPAMFAALSARVGSIGDNRIGGWHSYRASKAALNMLIRNFAIEMARTHKRASVVGLHPGTVDTTLSQPFQKNLPEGQLSARTEAADHLLGVLEGLGPDDSGKVFDWKGDKIEP
ncbi:SDR family NAD(P)-dependent oxidoreductase [Aurantiacibacter aquimixticola]|uniref:SDR family NAD(P)-dependent oxidoreductase n=1 Tax=Aurantiacibacter aquimixticola TaxID=1958945 RepID=A0A419RS36_9SPHN|nr:SDR family NAD(P)-dependent oxidoreductase [Aurantiacibacter aquimixticola]RJY08598.1 SDR family NAD(P)-dependent oxidoreductase [Aurantiacibacter aquimixticola]